MDKLAGWESQWVERILESVAGMKYGTVQLIIHDGKLVQIERTEKRRFEGKEHSLDTSKCRSES